MDSPKATLQQLADEYTTAMRESDKFGFLVRDSELQLQQVEYLDALKKRIKTFKRGAINANDENAANALFHLQCGLNAKISFLRMWAELKKGAYDLAWGSLMDAEEYVSIAMRAADGGIGLEKFLGHLKKVEDVVFPGYHLYNSCGLIIAGGQCTVCGKPFCNCPHIEGRIYWGRLCVRVGFDVVSLDHAALTKEPRDRRCVITEITTDDGYYRDYMTWRKTKKAEEKKEGTLSTFSGVMFSNKLLEID